MEKKIDLDGKRKERIRSKKRAGDKIKAKSIAAGIAVFGASFLLGFKPLLFGTYPMGLALLCASGGYIGFILPGLVLAGALSRKPVYICVYAGVFLLRLIFSALPGRESFGFRTDKLSDKLGEDRSLIRGRLFGENLATRLIESLISSAITGVIGIFIGGFQFYDLFGLLFLILSTPVLTFLYSTYSDCVTGRSAEEGAGSEPTPKMSVRLALGGAALILSVVFAASGVEFFGIKPAPAIAMALTLLICRRRGFLYGVGASVLAGVACDPASSPMFVIAALLYSLLKSFSEVAGVAAVLISSAGWCIYSGGISGFIGVYPSVVIGIPLFYTAVGVMEFGRSRKLDEAVSEESDFAVAVMSENMLTASRNRMFALSEAFSSLSEIFFDLSDRFRRPQVLDLRRICDDACEKRCKNCPSHDVCWGAGYSDTLDMINKLAGQLHTRGHASRLMLPDNLKDHCLHIDRLIDDINRECGELTAALLKNDKTAIFASDYQAISTILNDSLEEDNNEYECDREAAGKIFEYLTSRGTSVYGVVVCGKRAKHILVRGVGFSKSAGKTDELKRAIGEICETRLGDPIFEVGDDCTVMMLSSEAALKVEVSAGSLAAERVLCTVGASGSGSDPSFDDGFDGDEDGDFCGDTTDYFSNDNLYFYSLVSDGMGTGREAMFTSKICSVFLEKMLVAGNHTDVTLRMLNSFIRSKNSCTGTECSATVDLMELDLLNGSASFAKSGAAPTYIVRDGSVFILRSRTLPIGIIRAPDVCITKSEIKSGDVIVMVSDGVTQNNDECPWLVSLLATAAQYSPDEFKCRILSKAHDSGSPDDISAVVMKISQV